MYSAPRICPRQSMALVMLLLGISFVGYIPTQSQFYHILLGISCAFAGYVLLIRYPLSWPHLLLLGIILRVVLIFAFPNLSDDIYRFVWDGELAHLGLNPYSHLPTTLVDTPTVPVDVKLYDQLNSPNYYTIYPIVAQAIFYLSTMGGISIYMSSIIMKLCFLLAEGATFIAVGRLLSHMERPRSHAALYVLNPLVILEGTGNLHLEVVMLAFFSWALVYFFVSKRYDVAAMLYALSIGSKLLTVMFLPYFLLKMRGHRRVRYFLIGAICVVLLFAPLLLALAEYGSSINLYFQKFEFNASIYYLLRGIGQYLSGYNLIWYIGPGLALITVGLITRRARAEHTLTLHSFVQFAFFAFVLYLFLATTVHPWYLIVPIFLSLFVQFRFVIIWSYLIFLTYINYHFEPFHELMPIIWLEYAVVFAFLLFEVYASRAKKIAQG